MEIGLYALGALSLLYYIFLVWYTKRWNSTFSRFWCVFSLVNFGFGILVQVAPQWVDYSLIAVFTLCWLVFVAVEVLILCAMVSLVPRRLDYLVVLGAQIRDKKVTETLKRRLDRALRYLQENPETLCIVAGGKGKDEEISEAEAMAEYLKACGIEPVRILMEDQSRTTYENFKNSIALFPKLEQCRTGIVTSNFHIYRSMKLAKAIGYKKVYAVPASTNIVMFLNYMVREFFAIIVTIAEYKKKDK